MHNGILGRRQTFAGGINLTEIHEDSLASFSRDPRRKTREVSRIWSVAIVSFFHPLKINSLFNDGYYLVSHVVFIKLSLGSYYFFQTPYLYFLFVFI